MAHESEAWSFEDLSFEAQSFDVAFHPARNIIAVGLVNGRVALHEIDPDGHKPLALLKHHKKAVRSVEFSTEGNVLYSGSSDGSISIVDLASGKLASEDRPRHTCGVNVVSLYDPNVLVSGDDDGSIKLWDIRERRSASSLLTFTENEDFISDLCAVPAKHHLLATSGDGHFAVYDVRRRGKLEAMSDNMDDELLSVVLLKNGRKVVCGSQEGVLLIFTYGNFGDVDDRFPGHANSVEALLKVDEDTVLSASGDGLIRVVQLQPHKLLGVVGEHGDFPVEVLAYNHDHSILASSSHDSAVKFWDIRSVPLMASESKASDAASATALKPADASATSSSKQGDVTMSSDEEEEEKDDDDEMDAEEDEEEDSSKAGKTSKRKGKNSSSGAAFKSAVSNRANFKFFDGL